MTLVAVFICGALTNKQNECLVLGGRMLRVECFAKHVRSPETRQTTEGTRYGPVGHVGRAGQNLSQHAGSHVSVQPPRNGHDPWGGGQQSQHTVRAGDSRSCQGRGLRQRREGPGLEDRLPPQGSALNAAWVEDVPGVLF